MAQLLAAGTVPPAAASQPRLELSATPGQRAACLCRNIWD